MHLTRYGDGLVWRFGQLNGYLRIAIHAGACQPLRNQILCLMQSETFDMQTADQRKLDRCRPD